MTKPIEQFTEELIEFGLNMKHLTQDPSNEEEFGRLLKTELGRAFTAAMHESVPADPKIEQSFWNSMFIKKRYPFLEKLSEEYAKRYGKTEKKDA